MDYLPIMLIAVRIDGKRVLVGTHDGLAVYEDGKWKTYTTKDGLAHNGVSFNRCQQMKQEMSG